MAQKFTVPVTIKQLSTSGSDAITVYVDADTYARLKVEAGGRLTWSSGSATGDVNLYRDGADVLKTDDTFKASALFVDGIEIDTTGATTNQILKYDGTKFAPSSGGGGGASAIDDLADVTITSAASGDFLKYNGTAWINDAIDLGTDTTGSYVSSLVAGTGITLANNSGEGATPTISIGQAVGTASSVTFGSLIVPTIGQNGNNIDINATNVYFNTGANLYDDNGTVTIAGSLTVTGTITGTLSVATQAIIFEGNTADAYETSIETAEPTADRTITFPDASGTVSLTSDVRNAEIKVLMEVM